MPPSTLARSASHTGIRVSRLRSPACPPTTALLPHATSNVSLKRVPPPPPASSPPAQSIAGIPFCKVHAPASRIPSIAARARLLTAASSAPPEAEVLPGAVHGGVRLQRSRSFWSGDSWRRRRRVLSPDSITPIAPPGPPPRPPLTVHTQLVRSPRIIRASGAGSYGIRGTGWAQDLALSVLDELLSRDLPVAVRVHHVLVDGTHMTREEERDQQDSEGEQR